MWAYTNQVDPLGIRPICWIKYQLPMTTLKGESYGSEIPRATEYLIDNVPYTLVRTDYRVIEAMSVDSKDLDQDGDVTENIMQSYFLLDVEPSNVTYALEANFCT